MKRESDPDCGDWGKVEQEEGLGELGDIGVVVKGERGKVALAKEVL